MVHSCPTTCTTVATVPSQRTELDDDDDDDFDYTGVVDDDEEDAAADDDDDEEDLDGLLQSVHLKKTGEVRGLKSGAPLEPVTAQRPCVMDDFLRNFLIKMDMTKTLDQFNTEWYELKSKGKLNEEDVGPVRSARGRFPMNCPHIMKNGAHPHFHVAGSGYLPAQPGSR